MEKIRKSLMITSLVGIGIVALMLIAAVFGVNVFKGWPLKALLIVATIAVASGVAINELNVIKRKRILGFVGLGLLALSTIFAIIIFATDLINKSNDFNTITGLVALNSILFISIISLYSKLGKSAIALQIPAYISLIGIDVFLSLLIVGINLFSVGGMIHLFVILCILALSLSIALSVISSKNKGNVEYFADRKNMVTISKEEYETLKNENQMLKEKIEKLKQNL